MRVVKEAEVRRREILLAARQLFIAKGYEQTSVNDVLNVVGIAKGTFYYHFKSKEEVLEAIIIDIVEEGAFKAKQVLNDAAVPLPRRMMLAILAQAPDFEGAEEIKTELHRVENVRLHDLYVHRMLKRMTEVMSPTVAEGVAAGVFNTEYPVECVETLLLLAHMMFDCDTFDWQIEQRQKKLCAFLTNMERLFGTKTGELLALADLLEHS